MPQRLPAALTLALLLIAPTAAAQDEDAPPPELDPGRAILPIDPDREPNRVELELGRRTTFFEGPLREDGTVDYIAALNELYSEGVTLENNAFTELVLLTPRDDRSEDDARILEALGLPARRDPDALVFVSWEEYAREHGIDDWQNDAYFLRLDDTITPDGQDWLEANREALDRIVAASERSRYWAPMIDWREDGGFLIGVLLNHLGVHRSYARALQARVFLAAQEGDSAAATDDLLALRRLAAHSRHEPHLISVLVGISIDAITLEAVKILLYRNQFDAEDLARLSAGWDERATCTTMAEAVDVAERCMGIDALMQLWAGRISWYGVMEGFVDEPDDLISRGFRSSLFDINDALRTLNDHYDREAQMMRVDDYGAYMRFHARWEAQYDLNIRDLRDNEAELAATLARVGLTRSGRTEFLTSLFINIMMPALDAARRTEFRCNTHDYAVYLAIQCERYRLATGNLPASLEDLVPDYLDAAPIDPLDGEPMRYRTTDAGFVVYSVGTDLEDHGGTAHDYQDGGDIAVGVGINVNPDWAE